MEIFIHRVNTIEKLGQVPQDYGIEIDIRGYGSKLFLNHDPLQDNTTYTELEALLDAYVARGQSGGIILNVKEAGYEDRLLKLMETFGIRNYFLLDVEFPYLYRATRTEAVRAIAVRYSEAEPIEAALAQMDSGKPLLDWVWIDTNTQLPLTPEIVKQLQPFKTCLVCPERWGRPEDIEPYAARMKALDFTPTAVMTSLECASLWSQLYTT